MKNNKQLNDKIYNWLQGEGYPLEMKVADTFRKDGFGVSQAYYYTDPQTGKLREMDVIATAIDKYTASINVSFVIECKSNKRHPWLLFTSKHSAEGYNKFFTCCLNSLSSREILFEKKINLQSIIPLMKNNKRVAYGATQALKKGNNDNVYKAAVGVLKASEAILLESESHNSQFNFIFPTIILDGNLFECFTNSKNIMELKEINHGFYLFTAGQSPVFIHIVTVEMLKKFVQEGKIISDKLLTLCAENAKIEIEKMVNKYI